MTDPPKKTGITAFLNPEQMNKLNRLVLLSRSVVEGNLAGAHRSPLRGVSAEFADHKAYALGDDIKHIDWKVLGRTDRYYVKRFEDETNLRVYLVVDRSNSMAFSGNGPSKYEYACRLAAAIGYVVVKARDSVGLFLHSDKIDARMAARNSLNHLNNLLKVLQEHSPASTSSIADSLHQVAASVHKRALIVVLSDLLGDETEICRALAHFRKQNHDVIVLHVLDPIELDLSFKKGGLFEDMETGATINVDPRSLAREYERLFGEFLEQYRKSCAGLGIDYRLARTDTPPDTFVRAFLEERQRLAR